MSLVQSATGRRRADGPRRPGADAPAKGQVLVQVRASSVHPDVWHVITGTPAVLRVMGAGLRRPPGRCPAPTSRAWSTRWGPACTRFRPGDQVFGEMVKVIQWRNAGTWAEFAAVDADLLAARARTASPSRRRRRSPPRGSSPSGRCATRDVSGRDNASSMNGAAGGRRVRGADRDRLGRRGDRGGPARQARPRPSFGAAHVVDAADDYTRTDERYDLVSTSREPPISRGRIG